MAKTLLNGVNEILKRVGVISGDAGTLSSLTDSARQRPIDVSVQVINEGIDELYSVSNKDKPKGQAQGSITLVNGTKSYAMAADTNLIRWPLIDRSNSQFIQEYGGGYSKLLLDDPEQDDTGLPYFAAINPVTGYLTLDRTPTSTEAGRVYYYQYDKDLELSVLTDEVPFDDPVFRAMVPAWVQLWKREMRKEFDEILFKASMGRAARMLRKVQPRSHYSPRG